MSAGLQSGFVTLPRHSRLDRQFHDGDVGTTLTRSDSLTSFTVDLGPSLMSEVLSLIDNPSSLQMSNHKQAAGEEQEEEGEKEEDEISLTETPVQSPGVTSPNLSVGSGSINNRGNSCSPNWTEQEEERSSLRTPDASTRSPKRAELVMEAERFQRAADVLSRHYGGGSFTRTSNSTRSPAFSCSRKGSCTFTEDEEEIKV